MGGVRGLSGIVELRSRSSLRDVGPRMDVVRDLSRDDGLG